MGGLVPAAESRIVHDAVILESPADLRATARRGEWTGSTAGQCPRYQQANLVIIPSDVASEFASFCTRNPKPCPLIEITPPGDPEPRLSAPGASLRTDVPGYRVYQKGELVFRGKSLDNWWRDDLVGFLLGCSFTFEHALTEAGVSMQHTLRGTTVPMFVASIECVPAGRFTGPMVVTFRAIPRNQLEVVLELSSRYPHAHGAPVHVGDPAAIGISDIEKPDFGDPVPVDSNDVPVFWACGVTPQAVARAVRLDFMITHEPGQMFLTDLPREGLPLGLGR
jgi:uncharacterized protein YcsI (UPF0317 family)